MLPQRIWTTQTTQHEIAHYVKHKDYNAVLMMDASRASEVSTIVLKGRNKAAQQDTVQSWGKTNHYTRHLTTSSASQQINITITARTRTVLLIESVPTAHTQRGLLSGQTKLCPPCCATHLLCLPSREVQDYWHTCTVIMNDSL